MDSIKHYGILGMQWGRRKGDPSRYSSDHTSSRELKKKPISEMSNDELQKYAKRIELEKKVKDMNRNVLDKGQAAVIGVLAGAGMTVGAAYATKYLGMAVAKIVEKIGLPAVGVK